MDKINYHNFKMCNEYKMAGGGGLFELKNRKGHTYTQVLSGVLVVLTTIRRAISIALT